MICHKFDITYKNFKFFFSEYIRIYTYIYVYESHTQIFI